MLINRLFRLCGRRLKTCADYTLISLKYHNHPTITIGRLTPQSSLARHVHLHSDIVSYHRVPHAPAEFDTVRLHSCLVLAGKTVGHNVDVIQCADDCQMPRSSTESILPNKDQLSQKGKN